MAVIELTYEFTTWSVLFIPWNAFIVCLLLLSLL